MAQVYSANVVGYVNQDLVKGWNLVCNPLENQENNTVVGLYGNNLPPGTTIYKWVNDGTVPVTGYVSTIFVMDDFWMPDDFTLVPGEGAFLLIPSDAPADKYTITYVGEVQQKADSNMKVQAGFTMISSKVPQAGLITTDLGFPAADADTVYTYAGGYQNSIYLGAAEAWLPEEPTIQVGQGFWSLKGAAADWVRDFDANAE